MKQEKIFVTGIGIVSSLGIGVKNFFEALIQGQVGFSLSETFMASLYPPRLVGEVKSLPPVLSPAWQTAAQEDRFLQFGLIAVQEAIASANLSFDLLRTEKTGVILGTGSGRLDKQRNQRIPLLTALSLHSISSQINAVLKLHGPAIALIPACAAGNNAIGYAFDLLQAGIIDIAITGGVDALTLMDFASFNAFKALANGLCKPFDKNRDGLLLGEGAGILILEKENHVQKRGASKIYAEIAGYGLSNEAYHIATPNPTGKGAASAMRSALKHSMTKPHQIDYINAHGTGTVRNDVMETIALKEVFGKYAYKIPVSSTKSNIGHALGAAGGLEAVICILAIEHEWIPPTIGLNEPDEKCDLDYVPGKGRHRKIKVAMSNSFGFGGHSASIVVKAPCD
ncbi:MAG: beta-ketoacyl-[acyl-carrier-protein] synthase family protein [Desulfobacteraceae bacterium]|jgi:3-oxoacyl-[acyl-carrier-protein] synthase II